MFIVTAWLPPDELAGFQQSAERCFADSAFLGRFYERFLSSSDEVAKAFEKTDLKKQAETLKRSLYLVMRAAHGLEDGLDHLSEVAESHGKRGLNIGPHLYQYWLDALLATAGETDPQWDDELDKAWRATLQPCIDRMIEGGR